MQGWTWSSLLRSSRKQEHKRCIIVETNTGVHERSQRSKVSRASSCRAIRAHVQQIGMQSNLKKRSQALQRQQLCRCKSTYGQRHAYCNHAKCATKVLRHACTHATCQHMHACIELGVLKVAGNEKKSLGPLQASQRVRRSSS